ncbi:MAG: FlgD immunoglobulin-like domain containing protein, partial [Armatimonadota bacterium]
LDGAEEEPLRISHTKAPGVASFAAMLPGRKPTGVSGTGTLVTLRFTALEPTDEPPLRVKTALLADEQRRVSAPRVSVAPLRIARLGPNDWRARIVARVDGLEPVSRPFGIIEDETLRQALGTRRIEADPALDVRFLTDEGEAPAAYRGPDDGPVSFRFAVSSDRPNADVLLTVPDLRLLPRRHALRLTDETGGAVVHLRTRNTYRFNTGANPGQRTFRLDVLDARAAVLRVSDLVARPLRGGGVVLQIRLSADAATSIDVTNLAGIRVRRLEKGTLRPAGPQSATWDGKSDAGTVAPAGTYIVRVRAASEDGRTATATTALTLQR